jgi:HD-like signal output (HDOD) protein
MHELATLVEKDPGLASHVLRISNSAYYTGIRGGNADIRMAVTRIGLRQVQNVVETVMLKGSFPVEQPSLRVLQHQIWRYSVTRAVAMRALADLAPMRDDLDPETAYTAGLLADTGALFLLWLFGERAASEGSSKPVDIEGCKQAIRQHHEDIGAALLERWGLGAVVSLIARTHHSGAPPAPPRVVTGRSR